MSHGTDESGATLGDRIAEARVAHGMDQATLARSLGLRVQTVRNWEEDRSEPRANRLQMLAGLLNVSMIWLMTGAGEGPHSDETPSGTVAEALAELKDLRLQHMQIGNRLARVEKRLRTALSEV